MKKITDVFLAGAIGDAFGYLIEFDHVNAIKAKYGYQGLTYDKMFNGVVCSDDTQMTLFLLEAIKNWKVDTYNENVFQEIAYDAYLKWYYTQCPSEKETGWSFLEKIMKSKEEKDISGSSFSLENCNLLIANRAPGMTCLSAMKLQKNSLKVDLKNDVMINDSMGCGSIMRVAPVLALKEKFNLSSLDLVNASHLQSSITHCNYEGMFVTAVYTLLLNELLNGTEKKKALSKVLDFMYEPKNDKYDVLLRLENKNLGSVKAMKDYFSFLEHSINSDTMFDENEITEKLGEGWITTSCFGVAYYAFMKTDTFDKCLEVSANHNGDSDSTATLAAQLYASCNKIDFSKHKKTDLTDIVFMLSEK